MTDLQAENLSAVAALIERVEMSGADFGSRETI